MKIELLGGFRAYIGNRSLPKLPTQKTKSLFAYLVTHRDRSHPREVLAELLWGEFEADRARSNLRQALFSLRQAVGSYLLVERDQVSFNTQRTYWLDVEEFEDLVVQSRDFSGEKRFQALRRALDLYRGDFLPGFYDDWVLAEESRLKTLYQQAAETLALWPRGPFVDSPALEQSHEAELKLELAKAHHHTKNMEPACALAEQALKLYEQTRDPIKQADAHLLIGSAQRHLGQYPQAADCYLRALELGHQAGDIRTEWRVLNNLGWLEWNLQHSRQAQAYYEQALPLCRQLADLWGEAVILNNWGIAHLDLKAYVQALERFAQAYKVISTLEDKELALENFSYRALAHLNLKSGQKVDHCVQRVLELLQQGVGGRLSHKAHLNIWRVLRDTGHLKQARQHLQWAYENVMGRAQKLGETRLRESFLEGNRTNREILAAWCGKTVR